MLVILCAALASVGPLLVESGVVPSAYAATGLTNMTITFFLVALVLAIWCPGYVAMTQYTPTGGAMYAIATEGLGRLVGVPASRSSALLSYGLRQAARTGLLGVQMSGFSAQQRQSNALLVGVVAWAGCRRLRSARPGREDRPSSASSRRPR